MKQSIDTICVQGGWKPKNGETRVLPLYQSTTYKYDSAEEVADLFDLKTDGHMYSRISNPTLACLESKIAELEKGTAAVLTSSGQSAVMLAVMNICSSGDDVVCSSSLYAGTINLLGVTLKRFGISLTAVNPDLSEEEISSKIKPNTKALYAETLSNPGMVTLDIEKFSRIARRYDIPLIIDNTFATPYFCNPIDYGANVIIHSTTKYMDGHASALGGVVVDCGNYDWSNGKFPELCTPDESYHGVVYTEKFGSKAYAEKLRCQLIRDTGAIMAPFNAYLTNMGLETLHLRMQRHYANAMKVARFLEGHKNIEHISYPGLESSKYYELTKKYMPKGICGVMSFDVKGGKAAAMRFLDSLDMIAIVVHVADARTSVLHPASSTHRQLSDAQLKAAGIGPGLIRLSVGIEDADDIIADIAAALDKI